MMFGMLLLLITVLFAPTSLTLTADESLDLKEIIRYARGPIEEEEGDEEVAEESDWKVGEDGQEENQPKTDADGTQHNILKQQQHNKKTSKWGPGRPVDGIILPENVVIMANHQAYLDWMYIWVLGYLACSPSLPSVPDKTTLEVANNDNGITNKHHGSKSIIILLKKSLKWVPIVGWGM